MSEHAMDWINRARHLQLSIEQMVYQIISHFSYHVSLALRGLRILITNDLLKELTYLQRSNAFSSNSSTQNNPSNNPNLYPRQNNYSSRQNQYPPRQNNYNRPQYHQSQNPASPPEPNQVAPLSGN